MLQSLLLFSRTIAWNSQNKFQPSKLKNVEDISILATTLVAAVAAVATVAAVALHVAVVEPYQELPKKNQPFKLKIVEVTAI